MENFGRRAVLGLAVAAGGATVGACSSSAEPTATGPTPIGDASGARQEGVDTPVPRQRYVSTRVLDFKHPLERLRTRKALDDLGVAIDGLARVDNLTVTVGFGPRLVRRMRGNDFVGSTNIPAFARDRIEGGANSGFVFLQICADRQETTGAVAAALVVKSGEFKVRWGLDGYRGQTDGTGARDLLGFYDGVAVPTTAEELDADVWTAAEDGIADATIAVIRRIRMDHRTFGRLPVAQQEAVIGRRKSSGAPLTGGTIDSPLDLDAKDAGGGLVIPVDAHARRAHLALSAAGGSMLRRNYSFRADVGNAGLIFLSFQRRLEQFVRVQTELERGDRLMDFADVTGTGTFLIVPRWSTDKPLGSVLAKETPASPPPSGTSGSTPPSSAPTTSS